MKFALVLWLIILYPSDVQRKVKTVAELEADMHSSPQKVESPIPPVSTLANQAGDMTAFNKLLTMVNAASAVNQNTVSWP